MSDNSGSNKKELNKAVALHFRDEFRQAREAALRDAEAFDQIIFVLESLGTYLHRPVNGLGQLKEYLCQQANISPLAEELPAEHPHLHISFDRLFEIVEGAVMTPCTKVPLRVTSPAML